MICLCKKKKQIEPGPVPSTNTSSASIKSPEQKMFIFRTTSQFEVNITIDIDKTIGELISLYFQTINRTDLIGDKNISFIWNSRVFFYDSKTMIKIFLKNKNVGNIIVVNDLDDKIDSTAKNWS